MTEHVDAEFRTPEVDYDATMPMWEREQHPENHAIIQRAKRNAHLHD